MSADTAAAQTAVDTAPAGGAEPMVPKSRLDEVLASQRRLEDALQVERQLYNQQRAREQQSQNRGPSLPTAEDLGLDPQTHKALATMVQAQLAPLVAQKDAEYRALIGAAGVRAERAELLGRNGPGSAKYLKRVEELQVQHQQATGGWLPAEQALQIAKSDEAMDENSKLRAEVEKLRAAQAGGGQPATQTAAAPAAQAAGGPSGRGTSLPGAGAGGGSAAATGGKPGFSEMSEDEQLKAMESALEAKFKEGNTL